MPFKKYDSQINPRGEGSFSPLWEGSQDLMVVADGSRSRFLPRRGSSVISTLAAHTMRVQDMRISTHCLTDGLMEFGVSPIGGNENFDCNPPRAIYAIRVYRTNNPRDWMLSDAALKTSRREPDTYKRFGFVFADNDSFIGIDQDAHRNEEGEHKAVVNGDHR